MIEITEVTSLEELSHYKKAWNHLLQESETNVVFLTYEWNLSNWEGYGDTGHLMVLIAKKDGQTVGIAPLAITKTGKLGRRLRTVAFISSNKGEYNDIIVLRKVFRQGRIPDGAME